MKPLIYFSYGMTKSGSTLAYELARSALLLSGKEQPRLSLAAVHPREKLNFISHVSEAQASAITHEIASIGHTVALKTHTRPDPPIVEMLQRGEAFAHAIFRDPREMALSMCDHGERARAKGRPAFSEYATPHDCIANIAHQTNTLKAWLTLPNVLPLYYDDFAFAPDHNLLRIMEEIGAEAPVEHVIEMATVTRFTQLNKGVPERWKTEMTDQMSETYTAVFRDFFALIEARDTLPRDGRPVLAAETSLCDWNMVADLTGETP